MTTIAQTVNSVCSNVKTIYLAQQYDNYCLCYVLTDENFTTVKLQGAEVTFVQAFDIASIGLGWILQVMAAYPVVEQEEKVRVRIFPPDPRQNFEQLVLF